MHAHFRLRIPLPHGTSPRTPQFDLHGADAKPASSAVQPPERQG